MTKFRIIYNWIWIWILNIVATSLMIDFFLKCIGLQGFYSGSTKSRIIITFVVILLANLNYFSIKQLNKEIK